jgi:hypothetical protein
MLEAFSAPGRFWRGNLHAHSTASDGALPPAEVCAAYRMAGYDFACVTDHFRERYAYPLTDTSDARAPGFTTLHGAELHAPRTSRGVEWHILAVGLPPDFAPPAEGEDGPALARRARECGAFIAIAHPHWYQLQPEDGMALDAAHAVEIYNHTSFVHTDRGDGAVFLDAMLSAGRRLGAIAVDDAHWKDDDAFGGWVMVRAETLSPASLLVALREGRYYASQGPEIHDIAREGDAISIACSPAAAVMLVGPVSTNARHIGRNVTRACLPLERFRGGWCRAVVVDASGRRAWSNPLWLDP